MMFGGRSEDCMGLVLVKKLESSFLNGVLNNLTIMNTWLHEGKVDTLSHVDASCY